jgi:hypothetical protein
MLSSIGREVSKEMTADMDRAIPSSSGLFNAAEELEAIRTALTTGATEQDNTACDFPLPRQALPSGCCPRRSIRRSSLTVP